MGRPGPGPGDLVPAASFVAPVDPKAAPGSPAHEYESQVANLKNVSVVDLRGRTTQGSKIDMGKCLHYVSQVIP